MIMPAVLTCTAQSTSSSLARSGRRSSTRPRRSTLLVTLLATSVTSGVPSSRRGNVSTLLHHYGSCEIDPFSSSYSVRLCCCRPDPRRSYRQGYRPPVRQAPQGCTGVAGHPLLAPEGHPGLSHGQDFLSGIGSEGLYDHRRYGVIIKIVFV